MNDNELALKIVEEIERKKARVDELKSEGNMLDRDLDPSASSSLSSSSVGLIWQLFPTGVTDFAIGSFIRQEGIYTDSFSFIGDGQSFLARRVIITNEFYRTKEGNQKLRSLYPDFSSMINLRHPNVSLILGCQLSDQSPSKGFSLVVIEEHRQTTLLEILRRSGCIQFTKARDHMKQLINALAFLHSSNIITSPSMSRMYFFLKTPSNWVACTNFL